MTTETTTAAALTILVTNSESIERGSYTVETFDLALVRMQGERIQRGAGGYTKTWLVVATAEDSAEMRIDVDFHAQEGRTLVEILRRRASYIRGRKEPLFGLQCTMEELAAMYDRLADAAAAPPAPVLNLQARFAADFLGL